MHASRILLLLAALTSAPVAAQAELVADLRPGIHGSAGDDMIHYDGKLFFAASLPGTGAELFVASGRRSAELFLDLYPGTTGRYVNSSAPANFAIFGGKLFFAATRAGVGRELMVTDGTAAGTELFADLWTGGGSSPTKLTVSGSKMFFFGRTSSTSLGIFVTDGSGAGTRLLRNFGGQGVTDMGADGHGGVFFAAQSSAGVELWTSDGTALGTKLFKDLAPGATHAWPAHFARIGRQTIFTATTTPGKRTLWVTDGSHAGTVPVGSAVSVSSPLVAMGGRVFFRGDAGNGDRELWVSDGTAMGTKPLVDVRPGIHGSDPDWLTPVAGKWLYFSAQMFDGRGRELWRTDGTARGTLQVAEIYAGLKNGNPNGSKSRRRFAVIDDAVYFYAHHPVVGPELFSVHTGAATSYREGSGCGSKPTLMATFPKLGSTLTFSGARAPATAGLLALGLPTAAPVSLGSCVLRVDTSLPTLWFGVAAAGGNWTHSLAVPATASLRGTVLSAQAAFEVSAARGIDLSNGVRLLVGE